MSEFAVDGEGGAPEPESRLSEPGIDAQQWDLCAAGASWLKSVVDALSREHAPILKLVRRETVREIPDVEPVVEGSDESLYRPMHLSHEWVANTDVALGFDVEEFLAGVDGLAKSFADQLVSGMIGHIAAVTEAHGQTVDASGRNNWDAILDAIDKVDTTFTEDGESNGVLALHPDTYDKLMQNPPTPEQLERAERQLQRKREAYFASRRTEELP